MEQKLTLHAIYVDYAIQVLSLVAAGEENTGCKSVGQGQDETEWDKVHLNLSIRLGPCPVRSALIDIANLMSS